MNYKSFADLSADIKSNLHKIPKDISLVVGIPRSGLLAANLISVYLNLPLTDIDSFIKGHILSPCTQSRIKEENAFKGKILIVDDSVATGKAIVDARQKLASILSDNVHSLLFCCIYAEPTRKNLVDIPLVLLDRPRLFEWNIFHNSILNKACVEIDGVLCKPFEGDITKNEEAYKQYITEVQPNFIPKSKIALLVTSRQEKWRTITEKWLQNNKIQFDELVMAKNEEANPTDYKARVFKKRDSLEIFLEGSKGAADRIFELTGKDVYSLENNKMLTRMNYKKLSLHLKRRSIYLLNDLKESLVK